MCCRPTEVVRKLEVHCQINVVVSQYDEVLQRTGLTSYPVDASWYLGMWLGLTTTHQQTWLFSSIATCHSANLLTARGVAHLVVHLTSGSTSYETIPPVRLETSGGVLLTVDMVVQRRDGPRRLRDDDDEDEDDDGDGDEYISNIQ